MALTIYFYCVSWPEYFRVSKQWDDEHQLDLPLFFGCGQYRAAF